jgi:hypothetical protein
MAGGLFGGSEVLFQPVDVVIAIGDIGIADQFADELLGPDRDKRQLANPRGDEVRA